MAVDQFEELFSSVSKKKDDSKLSLNERQKLSLNNVSSLQTKHSNYWCDFDTLSHVSSSKTKSSSSNRDTPLQKSDNLFEGFNTLNTSKKSTVNPSEHMFEGFDNTTFKPNPSPQSNCLIDSFDLPPPSAASSSKAFTTPQSQSQDLDDLFAVFDKPASQPKTIEIPVPVHTQTRTIPNDNPFAEIQKQAQRPKDPTPKTKDDAIALLVDMGFSIEQVTSALNHTSTGVDVEEAISYIINGKHQKAREKAGHPLQKPERSKKSHKMKPEDYINNLTLVFSNVTNKVSSDLQNRFFSPTPSKDFKPAWLRDREKYRVQSQFDDDPDEIDVEALSNLSIKPSQRGPDEQDEILPQRQPRHYRSHQSLQRPSTSRTNTTAIQRPTSVLQPEPEPEVDLFAPLSTKSQPQHREEQKANLFSFAPQSKLLKSAYNNNEMRTSSRRRQVSRTLSNPATLSQNIIRSNPNVSFTQIEFFKDSKEQGGIAFKNGDFNTALTHYQTALESLPDKHTLRIIAYSNCIAAYFKVGENKKVIEFANSANELIGPNRGAKENVDEDKPMKDFWVKINQKKAEALENLEKFKEAQNTWLELIENGVTSKAALDGKRRCQDFLNPKPKTVPSKAKSQSTQTSLRKPQPIPRLQESEALKRVHESNKASELFEEEKYKLYDQIEAKVKDWKAGKEDNLRALLSSLQNILWKSCNWKPVKISDLIVPKKVKIAYMKAVAKVHPDKIPVTATAEQKLIAQSVFVVINQAWEGFKTQNGI